MPYSQPGKTLQMIKSPFGKEVYIVEEQVSEEKQDTNLSSKKRVGSGFFSLREGGMVGGIARSRPFLFHRCNADFLREVFETHEVHFYSLRMTRKEWKNTQ